MLRQHSLRRVHNGTYAYLLVVGAPHRLSCFSQEVRFLSILWLFGVVIALSLGQGALAASMEWLLPGDSVISMMAAWAAISCGIALGVLYLVRLCPPNNSFKAMPLRGTP